MRRFLPLVIFVVLLGCRDSGSDAGHRDPEPVLAQQQQGWEAPPRLDRAHAGKSAPKQQFQDPAGESVTLADFRGRPLLLNLWATWCAPCVTEMPMLDALAAREGGRLQVLTVSQDLNGEKKVDAFFEKHGFARLQPYIDPEANLTAELGVDTLPTTILYDPSGREVWRITGVEEWLGDRAKGLIQEGFKKR